MEDTDPFIKYYKLERSSLMGLQLSNVIKAMAADSLATWGPGTSWHWFFGLRIRRVNISRTLETQHCVIDLGGVCFCQWMAWVSPCAPGRGISQDIVFRVFQVHPADNLSHYIDSNRNYLGFNAGNLVQLKLIAASFLFDVKASAVFIFMYLVDK